MEVDEKTEINQLRDKYWLTYIIHLLAKEYGWSKKEIDQIYPDEVGIYIQFIAEEKKDKLLKEKLDYYQQSLDSLYIIHGKNPDEHRDRFIKMIEQLQQLDVKVNKVSNSSSVYVDDDLPDLEALHRLKEFKQSK